MSPEAGSLRLQREAVKTNVLGALRDLSDQEVCRRLDILPVGLEVLRAQPWTLDYACQVCVALGLDWKKMQG